MSAFGYGTTITMLLVFGGPTIVKALEISVVSDQVLMLLSFACVLLFLLAGFVDSRKQEA